MKIQCDVCEKEEAFVFCPADEAALCHGCDRSIHHANKLATKHSRFSLHHPCSKECPLCDICQERRAYIFCQEDRAILCRECELPIHRANEHTQKHNRFLLTSAKLSASSLQPSSSSSIKGSETAINGSEVLKRARSVSNENFISSPSIGNYSSLASPANYCRVEDNLVSDTDSVSTSSISEYLIEAIPGFCFEELLAASFPPPNGFCKNYEQQSGYQGEDLAVNKYSFPAENLASSVPQVQVEVQSPQLSTSNFPQISKASAVKGNWKSRNNGQTVPQISPPPLMKTCTSPW